MGLWVALRDKKSNSLTELPQPGESAGLVSREVVYEEIEVEIGRISGAQSDRVAGEVGLFIA